jgi:hypothetical protein
MRTRLLTGILVVVGAAIAAVASGETASKDAAEILRLHKELLDAHKNDDVEKWLSAETDRITVGNRGEVLFQTKAERRGHIEDYLQSAEFEMYEDVIEPIVRVSDDGTLGWLICQVEIVGSRVSGEGETVSLDSVWAWIELYEKIDGRWYRTGNVSCVKPREE